MPLSDTAIRNAQPADKPVKLFDGGWTDLAQSFMAIRKTVTESGRQVTFKADRSDDVSHADLAWAAMHALSHEPLAVGGAGVGAARMEIL